MPITRLYSRIALKIVDVFLPEENYTTLAAALAAYGLYASSTFTLTADSTWQTLTGAPAAGSGLLILKTPAGGSMHMITKGANGSYYSRINSVPVSGSCHLDCRWETVVVIRSTTNLGGSLSVTWTFISALNVIHIV